MEGASREPALVVRQAHHEGLILSFLILSLPKDEG
jgi:hypothetical protein